MTCPYTHKQPCGLCPPERRPIPAGSEYGKQATLPKTVEQAASKPAAPKPAPEGQR